MTAPAAAPASALRAIAKRELGTLTDFAHQCHVASLRLVRSGALGDCRVARGSCTGVPGQHSWVVVGDDCYADDARIIDPTLWSYTGQRPFVWVGSASEGLHTPHGKGSIWAWGRPENAVPGQAVELTPTEPLSSEAQTFLELLGPLDRRGWMVLLSHAPVGGWPAGEIMAAATDTEALAALVPIDRLGMLTDRNPDGLYR